MLDENGFINMGWAKCKQNGRVAEELVIELFKKHKIKITEDKSDLITHDLQFEHKDKKYHIEVKFDMMQSKTKNIAIEYFNTKKAKPSGINATKADLWCIVLQNPSSVWLTSTKLLKEYVKDNPGRLVDGGDNNSSMILYKSSEILESVFKRIDEVKKKEFLEILNDKLSC